MQFAETSKVAHPAEKVLETMIVRMEEIVPFLPNVARIDTLERKDLPRDRIRILRRWQGVSESVPSALRPFVSEEWLAWLDTAVWTPAEYKVDWTLSTSLSNFYECSGTNFFEPHPDDPRKATRIRITGDLRIHPEKLPGLPRFLGNRLAPQVEKFVVNLITPNLTDVAKGLRGYLGQVKKGSRSR